MEAAKRAAPPGHSGIGTTLSDSLVGLAALEASLADVITSAAHTRMQALAAPLRAGLRRTITAQGLAWSATRLRERMELQFCSAAPRNALEAAAAMDAELEQALHRWLLNRGVVVTPFHNM